MFYCALLYCTSKLCNVKTSPSTSREALCWDPGFRRWPSTDPTMCLSCARGIVDIVLDPPVQVRIQPSASFIRHFLTCSTSLLEGSGIWDSCCLETVWWRKEIVNSPPWVRYALKHLCKALWRSCGEGKCCGYREVTSEQTLREREGSCRQEEGHEKAGWEHVLWFRPRQPCWRVAELV